VLRQIKTSEQLSRLPVIVLTTSEAEKDVARAYEYRANSYIVKPMDYQKFTHLMDDLGFYWLAWNHNPWI
ncbi:MAG: response regulator, partial [Candidatus Thiodiazotropha endolucinida]